jgi:putative transposase
MGRMPQLVKRGKKDRRLGEPSGRSWEEIEALELDARVELIRALLPLGLAEVGRMLDEEVERLAGPRHGRKGDAEAQRYRHGSNPGSVRLGGQRHPIRVPRVRDANGEVKLVTYAELHGSSGEVDEGLFRKVLLGISCRDYEAAVEAVPGAIGMSKSQVSREFTKATAAKLKEFQERDLGGYDVVALFMDGKTFADDQLVLALGVTMDGDKVFLGFVQTDTENQRVITSFLRSLKDRGLDLSAGALVVVDGAKGLRSGALKAFGGQILIQRCQWHKRENVTSYLPRTEQRRWRGRMQKAYERPNYEEAKRDLKAIRAELAEVNQSAVASLDEGFEESLTLHRLGVFSLVGRSLKTTNVIESVNSMAEQRCGRVDHWKNSNQKHRWFATALLNIEPRLRRLLGYRHLPMLRAAIQKELGINHLDRTTHSVA